MVKISASAPGKAILLGEHYVVYGAPGLACAIEPSNELELTVQPRGPPGLYVQTDLGELTVQPMAGSLSDLSIAGPAALHPQAAVYRLALQARPGLAKLSIYVRTARVWPLKGVGNSASLAAALGAGLVAATGARPPKPAELVFFAQAADTLAHGGSPSGIDASAVSHGGAILYQKSFTPKPSRLEPLSISIPTGWSFLLADTLQPGEEKASTAEQIAAFAAAHAIAQPPAEMSAKSRAALCAPYEKLFTRGLSALRKKDMPAFGHCMDENQELLEAGGVSTPSTEHAIYVARRAGAVGAKISGAGGAGGLVLILCQDAHKSAIRKALEAQFFRAYDFKLAKKRAAAKKMRG